jgi:hypothetical protein
MRRVIRQRAKYYVPVSRKSVLGECKADWQMTEWLPNYSWSLFSGDVIAGVSLACLLIPQVRLAVNCKEEFRLISSLYHMRMVLLNSLLSPVFGPLQFQHSSMVSLERAGRLARA